MQHMKYMRTVGRIHILTLGIKGEAQSTTSFPGSLLLSRVSCSSEQVRTRLETLEVLESYSKALEVLEIGVWF